MRISKVARNFCHVAGKGYAIISFPGPDSPSGASESYRTISSQRTRYSQESVVDLCGWRSVAWRFGGSMWLWGERSSGVRVCRLRRETRKRAAPDEVGTAISQPLFLLIVDTLPKALGKISKVFCPILNRVRRWQRCA
jgi:hypothetical protein